MATPLPLKTETETPGKHNRKDNRYCNPAARDIVPERPAEAGAREKLIQIKRQGKQDKR